MKGISKTDWKEKIQKELKGKKSLDDLLYKLPDHTTIDILLQEEDRITNDKIYSFPEETKFGIYSNNTVSNQFILDSLKYGGSCLMITSHTPLEWDKLMEGVHLEMVDLFTDQYEITDSNPTNAKNVHKISGKEVIDIEESLAESTLFKDINKAIYQNHQKNIFFRLNDSYILTIALLRATRIAFQRYTEDYNIGTISVQGEDGDEYDLIRYTSQAQASQAGGSDFHFYSCDTVSSPTQLSRMMHVNNVINMESNHHIPSDPWQGAYVIEHMTRNFLELIEKGGRQV